MQSIVRVALWAFHMAMQVRSVQSNHTSFDSLRIQTRDLQPSSSLLFYFSFLSFSATSTHSSPLYSTVQYSLPPSFFPPHPSPFFLTLYFFDPSNPLYTILIDFSSMI